ncbi:MAG: hypothetical protein HOG89_01460 [Candidatus Peribacter sp.]|mgnify:CR=1 FL=1|jgi:hypothetical protein|nr:hypothetical protein [Candidatus Peribacter sp.]MBT4392476.1 hypothetical protein [Candidatus Peribacter sp.]MBT4601305.1 hypothetical protein [Candidatus Peribacter sp.]MBT5149243.1 hypothetical protein [Candidatus Peribacter sp.]MBT5638031.1 hypothetical protein [Candidatus Peribacter sp.]
MQVAQPVKCPLDRLEGVLTSEEGTALRRFEAVVRHKRATREQIDRAVQWIIARPNCDEIMQLASKIAVHDRKLRAVLELVYDQLIAVQFGDLLAERIGVVDDLAELAHYNEVGDRDAINAIVKLRAERNVESSTSIA